MKRRSLPIIVGLFIVLVGLLLFDSIPLLVLWQQAQAFVTIFLGIFIEAVPFLLAGAVISGLIAEFVSPDLVQRLVPRQPVLAAAAGALLGLTFPVCECGVVPVTRRLYQKGLPLPIGVAFLLAAPVINPVVIASTAAAYGWGEMLWLRLGAGFLIATAVGYVFHFAEPQAVLRQDTMLPHTAHEITKLIPPEGEASPAAAHPHRFWRALTAAGDEFLEMAQYLVIGCLLAAGMQVLIPQATLLAWGAGPVLSVFAMIGLAFILSVCSTVDAFVSLAFANTFATGAVLAFLVFGPMVDVKSLLLFRQVFRRRATFYLVSLPLLLTALLAIAHNLQGG